MIWMSSDHLFSAKIFSWKSKSAQANFMIHFILEREHDCGINIVYCVLPKDVSTVHAELIKNGVNCVKYHGQLSEELKTNSFTKWMNGE